MTKTFIETERLILREIDLEADIDPWVEMMSDEETVRYIGGQTTDRMMTWRSMVTMIGHQKVRGYSFM
jgi:RimJ/RimL family protein N-acetyltransferase